VSGAPLRLLQHTLRAPRLDDSGQLFELMAHHGYDFPRFQWRTRGHHVLHQAATARSVQHFRQIRLEPRAFSRGKNHNGKIMGGHRPIILREQNQIRNVVLCRWPYKCLISRGNGRGQHRQGNLWGLLNRFVRCNRPKRGIREQSAHQLGVERVARLVRFHMTKQWQTRQR